MGIRESFSNFTMNRRTLAAIMAVAILWRAFISSNGHIILWESVCSGVALFIMGWALFAYILRMSRELKGWLELNSIYRWIAFSVAAINFYVIVYYAMRWYRLAGVGGIEEVPLPLDFLYRDIRYIMLVIFYCVVMWLAKLLKKVHGDYILLFKQ